MLNLSFQPLAANFGVDDYSTALRGFKIFIILKILNITPQLLVDLVSYVYFLMLHSKSIVVTRLPC